MRNKDESIYNRDNKFFQQEEDSDADDESSSNVTKKQKPKRYKDLVREDILKKMQAEDGESNEDANLENMKSAQKQENMSKLAYDEEQKAIRAEFMNSDSDDEADEDNWLVKKKEETKIEGELEKDRLHEIDALSKAAGSSMLKDPKGEVEDGDKFLLDFVKNKRWVDEDELALANYREKSHSVNSDGNDSDDSLNELNRTDDFESKYNFRFEEANANSGAGLSIVGYSRSALSDTIRRKDDMRIIKRQERKDRKKAERKAKEEKLKRLKNAKKDELEERIHKIKAVLGETGGEEDAAIGRGDNIGEEMIAKLMEGDFDPEQFEDIMSKMYSDDFYEKEDTEWKNDLDVKATSQKSSEEEGGGLLLNDEDEDAVYDNGDEEVGDDGENNEEYDYDGAEEGDAEEEVDVKNESKIETKLKERMLDELYKLDYEDIIGDMPTRFKYRKVERNRFGLTPEEILFSRDTSLRQFVSLKRMAPYDEDGEYVPGSKKRRRFRDMAKQEINEEMELYRRNEPVNVDQGTGEENEPKKKRRRQKKGKKKDPDAASDVKEVEDSKVSNSNPDEDKKSRKRSRKKKGKKSNTINANEEGVSAVEGDDNKTENDAVMKENTSKKERKKERKRKKSKNQVDGVSSSRLASYGL